ncbi:MAG: transposase [[Clostridium] scindens]
MIKEYDERFNHILGYRRMASWMNHFNHTNYSKKRVHRIMQKLDIHAVIRKKKKNINLLQLLKRLKINLEEILMQTRQMRNGQQM